MSDLEPCIRCNSVDTCEIEYQYPVDVKKYLKLVTEKKIHTGGCYIDSNSPNWYCNNCGKKWKKLDIEKTYSVNYKQKFNTSWMCN